MKKHILRKIPFVIAAVALGAFAFSGLIMLLWNGILPAVLHIGTITIWQAAGILLLARILFGGMGRKHRGWRRHNRHQKWGHAHCAHQQPVTE